MSETLTRPPKRIFIIGPMTQGAQDSDGIALAAHIPNIATATRQVLERLERKLGARMPGWQVNTPENSPNDIPREVFSHMMHTDFAIADISTQSPNVFYELAILHAIGVRVIILGEPVSATLVAGLVLVTLGIVFGVRASAASHPVMALSLIHI